MSKSSNRGSKRSRCGDCSRLTELSGEFAARYVSEHLVPLEVRPGAALSRVDGVWGNFGCPVTDHVWYYVRDPEPDWPALKRYPYVSPEDLVSHRFWEHAAAELRRVHRAGVDHFEELNRMYSWQWRAYLRGLQVGEGSPEAAIVFLEVDPWCPYSGYEKQKVMRFVSRVELSAHDRERLASVVVAVASKGRRQEFAVLALLAKRIWTDELAQRLRAVAAVSDTTSQAVDLVFSKRFTH